MLSGVGVAAGTTNCGKAAPEDGSEPEKSSPVKQLLFRSAP